MAKAKVVDLTKTLKWSSPLTPVHPDRRELIVIHHPAAIRYSYIQVHNQHLGKGWKGGGYNEYIEKDGTVYIMRGDHEGGHATGYNINGYGISCEGNYDIEREMPKAQYDALVERIAYNLARMKNVKKVVGHREIGKTSCPGQYFPLAAAIKDATTPNYDSQLDYLFKYKVITDILGWKNILENNQTSQWVGVMLTNFVRENLLKDPKMVVELLLKSGIVTAPEYWENVIKGTTQPNPDYIKTVVERMAEYLKKME